MEEAKEAESRGESVDADRRVRDEIVSRGKADVAMARGRKRHRRANIFMGRLWDNLTDYIVKTR